MIHKILRASRILSQLLLIHRLPSQKSTPFRIIGNDTKTEVGNPKPNRVVLWELLCVVFLFIGFYSGHVDRS